MKTNQPAQYKELLKMRRVFIATYGGEQLKEDYDNMMARVKLSKCNSRAHKIEHDTVCGVRCSNCDFNVDNHSEPEWAAMGYWEDLCERGVEES